MCTHACRTVCGQTCTHARRHACQHPCRHGHAPNTTQQSERPLDACVCCNLHMCVLGAPVKSSKAHTPPPAPLGTAQPQMYKEYFTQSGRMPGARLRARSAIDERRMHEVRCAGSEDPLVTWWSGMAWRRRPEQAAVRQGRLGAAAPLSGHSAGACAEAHSHRQRVSNALRGCAQPERSAPSCGIHTALGGRA